MDNDNRMKKNIYILLACLLAGSVFGTNYYVKTDGDDEAVGTSLGTAWETIAKACEEAEAGDTVLISAGTYSDVTGESFASVYAILSPDNAGTAGNPIVFKGNGARPILRGAATEAGDGSNKITCLIEEDYITLDSLELRVSCWGGVFAHAAHTTVKYCVIDSVFEPDHGTGWDNSGGIIAFDGGAANYADYLEVSNCSISRAGPQFNHLDANATGINLFLGDTVWIHDNYFEDNNGAGIKLKAHEGDPKLSVYLVENNVFNGGVQGMSIPQDGGTVDSVVFRNNIVYNLGQGSSQDDWNWSYWAAFSMSDWGGQLEDDHTRIWIYNNTFVLNNPNEKQGAKGLQAGDSDGNSLNFFNNIVWDYQEDWTCKAVVAYEEPVAFYTDYNLYHGRTSEGDYFTYGERTDARTLAEWQANEIAVVTGKDANSTVADPLFVNGSSHDYRLQVGSPALTGGKGGAYPTYRGALGEPEYLTPIFKGITLKGVTIQ